VSRGSRSERNGPVDHFERRTPRAWASGRVFQLALIYVSAKSRQQQLSIMSPEFRCPLTADEFVQLMAAAEEQNKRMVQLHGHTSDISDTMEMAERVALVGMLWDVAYADGTLHPDEDLLIRRIAGPISVGDRDRVIARNQAQARHTGWINRRDSAVQHLTSAAAHLTAPPAYRASAR
jgi:uncharacterized tellurite resistance protein B-like protein